MLDRDTFASHSSLHVRSHSSVSHNKWSHQRCFGRLGTQGSAIAALNPLAAQRYMLHRKQFSSTVCKVVLGVTQASTSKGYKQCWKEWAGWCGQKGVLNNTISVPKLAEFLVHLLMAGLAWHSVGAYCSPISVLFCLETCHHHKASNHPIISKLRYNFYLQHPA